MTSQWAGAELGSCIQGGAAALVWGLWDEQLSRTVGSSRGFWINPGPGTTALFKCRNEIKGEVSAQSSSPGRTENRTQRGLWVFPQPGDALLARMSFLILFVLFSHPFSLTPCPVLLSLHRALPCSHPGCWENYSASLNWNPQYVDPAFLSSLSSSLPCFLLLNFNCLVTLHSHSIRDSATLPTQPLPLPPARPPIEILTPWPFPVEIPSGAARNLCVQPGQLCFGRRDKPGLSPACGLIDHLELCCRVKLLIQT